MGWSFSAQKSLLLWNLTLRAAGNTVWLCLFIESIPKSDYGEQEPGKMENLATESSAKIGSGKQRDQAEQQEGGSSSHTALAGPLQGPQKRS